MIAFGNGYDNGYQIGYQKGFSDARASAAADRRERSKANQRLSAQLDDLQVEKDCADQCTDDADAEHDELRSRLSVLCTDLHKISAPEARHRLRRLRSILEGEPDG